MNELLARGRDVELAMNLAQYDAPRITSHRNRRSAPSEEYGDGLVVFQLFAVCAIHYLNFCHIHVVYFLKYFYINNFDDQYCTVTDRYLVALRHGDDHHDDDYDEVTPFFNVPKFYAVSD